MCAVNRAHAGADQPVDQRALRGVRPRQCRRRAAAADGARPTAARPSRAPRRPLRRSHRRRAESGSPRRSGSPHTRPTESHDLRQRRRVGGVQRCDHVGKRTLTRAPPARALAHASTSRSTCRGRAHRHPQRSRRRVRGTCRRAAPRSPSPATFPHELGRRGRRAAGTGAAAAAHRTRSVASRATSAPRSAASRGLRPRPRATASGSLHAVIASSCRLPSGQCARRGASRRQQLRRAEHVARSAGPRAPTSWSGCAAPARPGSDATGQRLRLAGHRVGERLVDHHHPARPAQRPTASAGCSTDVGLVGLPSTTRSALVGHQARRSGTVRRRRAAPA